MVRVNPSGLRAKIMLAVVVNMLVLWGVLTLVGVDLHREWARMSKSAVRTAEEVRATEVASRARLAASLLAQRLGRVIAGGEWPSELLAYEMDALLQEKGARQLIQRVDMVAPNRQPISRLAGTAEVEIPEHILQRASAPLPRSVEELFLFGDKPYNAFLEPVYDQNRQLVGTAILVSERPTADRIEDQASATKRAMIIYFVIGLAGVMVFSIVFTEVIVSRALLRPVDHVKKALNEIAGGAELGTEVEVRTRDEIGELAEGLRKTQRKLRSAVEAARALAAGDLKAQVQGDGEMAGALRELRQSLVTLAAHARAVARGEISGEPDIRGDLGQACGEMAECLILIREHVEAVSRGELGREVTLVGGFGEAFRRMMQSLRQIIEQTRAVANGDLSRAVGVEGELGAEFNRMVSSLAALVKEVQEVGARIGESLNTIFADAEEQAAYAAQQRTSLLQASSTAEEFASTSRQIAANASEVADIAVQTLKAAQDGREDMDAAIAAMDKIRAGTEDAGRRIIALGQKTQSIGDVLNYINEIADQTNLLALNAGIEAARAGESGKAFSVVAMEIRNLAENVMERTQEIKDIITDIQNSTNVAVQSSKEESDKVETGVEQARKVGETLERMLDNAERTAEAAKQIQFTTGQQQTASEQLSANVREIADVTRQSADSSKNTMLSADQLRGMANNLKQAIGRFKVSG